MAKPRSHRDRKHAFLAALSGIVRKYAFKPVYLTNYEMAMDPAYVEFARDVIARGAGEVGMHLHAWNSPPLTPLTDDDWRHKPYLIEYPADQIRAKVDHMTKLLEDAFQTKMLSHRAGRWAFNEYYASLLLEYGYQVDCSVTPRVNWQFSPGNPQGNGGTDYSRFPSQAYFIDPQNIAKPGASALLEVPMSIQYKHSALMNAFKQGYDRLRGKRRSPSVNWLRPSGGNVAKMIGVAEASLAQGMTTSNLCCTPSLCRAAARRSKPSRISKCCTAIWNSCLTGCSSARWA